MTTDTERTLDERVAYLNHRYNVLDDDLGEGDLMLVNDLHQALKKSEAENARLLCALFTADSLALAVDKVVKSGALDARSGIADARLDYGDPYKYDFNNRISIDE